ncbi:MAG: class I SAM-dependent methyltransferase [Nitrospirae bacterium]|nr:class I SAM-dependent methyltransferase [Nitrospirota bacterium]
MCESEYFDWRMRKASVFCARFRGGVDFSGERVLDVGCGQGAVSFHAAASGAASVRGIDPEQSYIDFARNMLASNFGSIADRVDFVCGDIAGLDPDERYDVIISQAAFEHIPIPEDCLAGMKQRLAEGGRIYIGFGPLYNSPWGDHKLLGAPFQRFFPWSHLLFPEAWLVNRFNRRNPEHQVSAVRELGLNCYPARLYFEMIERSGLGIVHVGINASESPFRFIVNALRRFPGLGEYFTLNLYVVLEK